MNIRHAAAIAALTATAVGARAETARNGALYIALQSQNAVAVYPRLNGRNEIGRITEGVSGPVALGTDSAGTLYVSNSNNTITAYAFGITSPSTVYKKGVSNAQYITIGPDGSLYISNAGSNSVVQFALGAQTPFRTIMFGAPQSGIAVDSTGNLFVLTGAGDIELFNPGATTGTPLGFTGLPASALFVDSDGNFVVNNQGAIVSFARQPPYSQIRYFGIASGIPFGAFDFNNLPASLYALDTMEARVVRIAYPQGNFANVIDGVSGSGTAVAATPNLVR